MSREKMIKFTVIIPTRERCDVLKSALKTCTMQKYDNLEIIVSDNFSQDGTKEAVESLKDGRVRYINTGKRISMSDNWEFALSHVDSGYVSYLGDDDGLLPGALEELSDIINRTGCDAISCKTAGYSWPDHINKSSRNLLRIPLGTSLEKRDSKEMLTDVINFNRDQAELPSLYRGFVKHEVIKKAVNGSGRFFHSRIPDVYSGIAVACVSDFYYYSHRPFAISGASHHSIGAAVAFNDGLDNKIVKKFLSEDNMPFHNKLVSATSSPINVAESFLQAQDHLSCAKSFSLDIKKCIKAAMQEVYYVPEKECDTVIEEIKKIASLNQLEDYASEVIASHKKVPARLNRPVLGFNPIRNHIIINCSEFGVRNVYDASILCNHILVLEKNGYHSVKGIFNTAVSLLKRELSNKNLGSIFLKIK